MDERRFFRPAHALAEDIRVGRLGAEELTRFYLERIRRYDGEKGLNTVIELHPHVLQQARELDRHSPFGLLYGLPVLIKDNIDVRGLHTAAGSLALAGRVAREDAPVIAALRRQGAVILGKTNMTEFANYMAPGMPGGYSSRDGQVKSAYGGGRDPGGSSSGSAVALSAGFCAAAVGTDTSFSVVACAVQNGITGLKPPVGALSGKGILPIAHTLDSAGALTRDFQDALLLYAGMGGRLPEGLSAAPAEKLRLAVNEHNLQLVSPEQLQGYQALCERLREAGASFSRICQPASSLGREIMRYEFRQDLEQDLAGGGGPQSLAEIIGFYQAHPQWMPYGIGFLQAALDVSSGRPEEVDYLNILSERERLRAEVIRMLSRYDACIMTGPTNVMHVAGLPSLALRLGLAQDQTPQGIILYGADERRLYAAALTIERFCGGDAAFPQLEPVCSAARTQEPEEPEKRAAQEDSHG